MEHVSMFNASPIINADFRSVDKSSTSIDEANEKILSSMDSFVDGCSGVLSGIATVFCYTLVGIGSVAYGVGKFVFDNTIALIPSAVRISAYHLHKASVALSFTDNNGIIWDEDRWDAKLATDFVKEIISVGNETDLGQLDKKTQDAAVEKLRARLATLPKVTDEDAKKFGDTLLRRKDLRALLAQMTPSPLINIAVNFLDKSADDKGTDSAALDINEWTIMSALTWAIAAQQKMACKKEFHILETQHNEYQDKCAAYENLYKNTYDGIYQQLKAENDILDPDVLEDFAKKAVAKELKNQSEELENVLAKLEENDRKHTQLQWKSEVTSIVDYFSFFAWAKLSHSAGLEYLNNATKHQYRPGYSEVKVKGTVVGCDVGLKEIIQSIGHPNFFAGIRLGVTHTSNHFADDENYHGRVDGQWSPSIAVQFTAGVKFGFWVAESLANIGISHSVLARYAEWGDANKENTHQFHDKGRAELNDRKYAGHKFDSRVEQFFDDPDFNSFTSRRARLGLATGSYLERYSREEITRIDAEKRKFDATELKKEGDMRVRLSLALSMIDKGKPVNHVIDNKNAPDNSPAFNKAQIRFDSIAHQELEALKRQRGRDIRDVLIDLNEIKEQCLNKLRLHRNRGMAEVKNDIANQHSIKEALIEHKQKLAKEANRTYIAEEDPAVQKIDQKLERLSQELESYTQELDADKENRQIKDNDFIVDITKLFSMIELKEHELSEPIGQRNARLLEIARVTKLIDNEVARYLGTEAGVNNVNDIVFNSEQPSAFYNQVHDQQLAKIGTLIEELCSYQAETEAEKRKRQFDFELQIKDKEKEIWINELKIDQLFELIPLQGQHAADTIKSLIKCLVDDVIGDRSTYVNDDVIERIRNELTLDWEKKVGDNLPRPYQQADFDRAEADNINNKYALQFHYVNKQFNIIKSKLTLAYDAAQIKRDDDPAIAQLHEKLYKLNNRTAEMSSNLEGIEDRLNSATDEQLIHQLEQQLAQLKSELSSSIAKAAKKSLELQTQVHERDQKIRKLGKKQLLSELGIENEFNLAAANARLRSEHEVEKEHAIKAAQIKNQFAMAKLKAKQALELAKKEYEWEWHPEEALASAKNNEDLIKPLIILEQKEFTEDEIERIQEHDIAYLEHKHATAIQATEYEFKKAELEKELSFTNDKEAVGINVKLARLEKDYGIDELVRQRDVEIAVLTDEMPHLLKKRIAELDHAFKAELQEIYLAKSSDESILSLEDDSSDEWTLLLNHHPADEVINDGYESVLKTSQIIELTKKRDKEIRDVKEALEAPAFQKMEACDAQVKIIEQAFQEQLEKLHPWEALPHQIEQRRDEIVERLSDQIEKLEKQPSSRDVNDKLVTTKNQLALSKLRFKQLLELFPLHSETAAEQRDQLIRELRLADLFKRVKSPDGKYSLNDEQQAQEIRDRYTPEINELSIQLERAQSLLKHKLGLQENKRKLKENKNLYDYWEKENELNEAFNERLRSTERKIKKLNSPNKDQVALDRQRIEKLKQVEFETKAKQEAAEQAYLSLLPVRNQAPINGFTNSNVGSNEAYLASYIRYNVSGAVGASAGYFGFLDGNVGISQSVEASGKPYQYTALNRQKYATFCDRLDNAFKPLAEKMGIAKLIDAQLSSRLPMTQTERWNDKDRKSVLATILSGWKKDNLFTLHADSNRKEPFTRKNEGVESLQGFTVKNDYFTVENCLGCVTDDIAKYTDLQFKMEHKDEAIRIGAEEALIAMQKRYGARNTYELVRHMAYFLAHLRILSNQGVHCSALKRTEYVASKPTKEITELQAKIREAETMMFERINVHVSTLERLRASKLVRVTGDNWEYWRDCGLEEHQTVSVASTQGTVKGVMGAKMGVTSVGMVGTLKFDWMTRRHVVHSRDCDFFDLSGSMGMISGIGDIAGMFPGLSQNFIDGWNQSLSQFASPLDADPLKLSTSGNVEESKVVRFHYMRRFEERYKKHGFKLEWTPTLTRIMKNTEHKIGGEISIPLDKIAALPIHPVIGANSTETTTTALEELWRGLSFNHFLMHYTHARDIGHLDRNTGEFLRKDAFWLTSRTEQRAGFTELFFNVGREQGETRHERTPLLNELLVRTEEFEENRSLDRAVFNKFIKEKKRFLLVSKHFDAFHNRDAKIKKVRKELEAKQLQLAKAKVEAEKMAEAEAMKQRIMSYFQEPKIEKIIEELRAKRLKIEEAKAEALAEAEAMKQQIMNDFHAATLFFTLEKRKGDPRMSLDDFAYNYCLDSLQNMFHAYSPHDFSLLVNSYLYEESTMIVNGQRIATFNKQVEAEKEKKKSTKLFN